MALREWIEIAQLRWPTLLWPPKLSMDEDIVADFTANLELAGEHRDDMVLAFLCACGQPEAIEVFHSEYGRHIRAIAGKTENSADFIDEVFQLVIQRLLVAEEDSSPRISTYSGRGSLLAFIRAATGRVALNLLRTQGRRRESPLLDGRIEGMSEDPETSYFKRLYRGEFRQAFEKATGELASSDRLLLRLSVVEGLSIDKIASVIGTHRATAARRVAKARQLLIESTRTNLRSVLGMNESEVQSVLRLVQSQVNGSVRRLLGS